MEWEILRQFFRERGLVSQQIQSYNQFTSSFIQSIVNETPEVSAAVDKKNATVRFGDVRLSHPRLSEADGELVESPMMPSDARLRGLTYAAELHVDVIKTITVDGQSKIVREPNTPLGHVPVMVGSALCNLAASPTQYVTQECPHDAGGYFIVAGAEKVIMAQERMATNVVYVFPGKAGVTTAECRSTLDMGLRGGSLLTVAFTKAKGLMVQLPQLKAELPAFTVMRALGGISAKEFLQMCNPDAEDEILDILRVQPLDCSREGALAAVGGLRKGEHDRVEAYMAREVLPHVGAQGDKAGFVGHMVHKLLSVRLGRTPPDDRDNYINKRVDQSGVLLAQLFRQLYKQVHTELRALLLRGLDSKREQLQGVAVPKTVIPRGLKYALATGNWGLHGATPTRQGVSQVLNRTSFQAMLSHMRRVSCPSRDGKLTAPRQVHTSQWGLICPAETPEGEKCGLVKNLAVTAHISLGFDAEHILPCLSKYMHPTGYRVIANGTWVGYTREPEAMVRGVVASRRRGSFSPELSIAWDDTAVLIATDGGRLMRPLLIVEAGRIPAQGLVDIPTFTRLLAMGVAEYLDVAEQQRAYIAMAPSGVCTEHTHCEIHPSTINGLCAAAIPHNERNQRCASLSPSSLLQTVS